MQARQSPGKQVPDPKLKYQQLLSYAKKLPAMPSEYHTEENKVRGCVSQASGSLSIWRVASCAWSNVLTGICRSAQVWVRPEVRDGKIYWQADSDSALTKACMPSQPQQHPALACLLFLSS